MIKKLSISLWLLCSLIIVVACQETTDDSDQKELSEEAVEVASEIDHVIVELMNEHGRPVAIATLVENPEGGVKITLDGENLPPGEHGFHIHDRGECTPPDFESAGGHYNPTNSLHGFDDPEGPHAGDLENITVKEDGSVFVELDAPMVSLKRDHENTLFTEEGTSLIIHADPDDYISQPAGNAGERIACGVIGQ